MKRRLAVPLAISLIEAGSVQQVAYHGVRRLSQSGMDELDLHMTHQIAYNRKHIEDIRRNLEEWGPTVDCSDIMNELDFVRANVQLSILEVTGELDGIMSSEQVFEEAVA